MIRDYLRGKRVHYYKPFQTLFVLAALYIMGVQDVYKRQEVDMNRLDPMFEDAARLVVIHQQGSTSLIQRKFSIGYNRAGRIMDQLEKAGKMCIRDRPIIISPSVLRFRSVNP